MAKTKRKTLPKNFDELIVAGDMEALKAVFDDCEIGAYNDGFIKKPALSYHKIPDELVRWLVSQGADIEQRDRYGKTPLYHQAGSSCGNMELFLELGADIEAQENFGTTPLFHACSALKPQNARILIAHGASIECADRLDKRTPLAEILTTCRGGLIPKTAEIAEMLLIAICENKRKTNTQNAQYHG